ncbi:MAG: PG0541 family transporter-associated protein [Phycisphaerae bacterium]
MKIVMICYNEAFDEEIIEILEQTKVSGYTKWTKVLGKGSTSEPHMLSHVWPKANNVILTAVDEKTAEAIFEKVKLSKWKMGTEGLKAFMWQIDQMT